MKHIIFIITLFILSFNSLVVCAEEDFDKTEIDISKASYVLEHSIIYDTDNHRKDTSTIPII